MAAVELKPCPMCGGRPVYIARMTEKRLIRCECSGCRISTPELVFEERGGAAAYDRASRTVDLTYRVSLEAAKEFLAAAWNRRTETGVDVLDA